MEKHGGNIHQYQRNIRDFSANINPQGIPETIYQAMEAGLKEVIHYPDPDCRELKKAIAKKHGRKQEEIICGNGAADLIFRLALVLKPSKILLPAPTFVEYEEAFSSPAMPKPEILYYYMDQADFEIKETILDRMDASVGVMILCNPNNPTGKLIEGALMLKILKKAEEEGIFLLVDECFLDFVVDGEKRSLVKYIPQYEHLFVLKSFTKMYAIPGVRLGYGMTKRKDWIHKMEAAAQSWAVSHLAQKAGIAACGMKGYQESTAQAVRALRQELYHKLQKLPIRVWEGSANYLFFQVPGCEDLKEKCLERDICIRHCNNYRGLGADYYRVAVRNKKENEHLVKVLEQILGK